MTDAPFPVNSQFMSPFKPLLAVMPTRPADHPRFVGENLALAREAVGARVSEWTRIYGLGYDSKLSNWEAGRHYPHPWFLSRLCHDYGFTMDWFYRRVLAGVSSELAADLRRASGGTPAEPRGPGRPKA